MRPLLAFGLCALVSLSCDTFTGADPSDASADATTRDGGTPEADGSGPDAGATCESEPLWANQAGGPATAQCSTGLQDLRTTAQHCGRCERACPGKNPTCVGGYCMTPVVSNADIPLAVDDATLWYGSGASSDLERIDWTDGSGRAFIKGGVSDPVVAGYTLPPYLFARSERGLFRFDTRSDPPLTFGSNLAPSVDNGKRRRGAALASDRAYVLDGAGHVLGPDAPPGVTDAWELAANASYLFWAAAPWRSAAPGAGIVVSLWDPKTRAGRIEYTSAEGAIHSLASDAEYIYWLDVDASSQGVFRHRIGGPPTAAEKLIATKHATGIQALAGVDLRQQMLFVDATHVFYWELDGLDASMQPHFRLMKIKKCGGNAVPLVQDCANLGRTTVGSKLVAFACNKDARVVAK